MTRTRRIGAHLAVALGLLLPVFAQPRAAQAATFTPLALAAGWTNAGTPYRDAAVTNDNGIIRFRGAITRPAGAGSNVFTLPVAFRPSAIVYVPVSVCSSHFGTLVIKTDGSALVSSPAGINFAYCNTSLEGASFAKTATNFTAIPLHNGWTKQNSPYVRAPKARNVNGIIVLQGVIATTGTSTDPFTLPFAFRPSRRVYVPVVLCGGKDKGRLIIESTGTVGIQALNNFGNATCSTSLEGVSFAKTAANFTVMTLLDGWQHAPYSTRAVAVRVINGIVHFEGAANNGTTTKPFQLFALGAGVKPPVEVHTLVDVCNAYNGYLRLKPTGEGFSISETDLAYARCFTSFEGVSYSL